MMFQRKRLLKKDKIKEKSKKIFIFLIVLFIGMLISEYIYFNFSFGKTSYINPIAKNKTSSISLTEETLYKAKISFTDVSLTSDGSLKINLKDGGEVILSSKKDIQSQISSLQLILSRLTIEEGKKLKSLDFRYDSPVVSF
ncbi:MAG TPA: hypothetical protein VES68_01855 [Candidatus Sulfotelmatobacter sp.]|nr:hypothetical protein [Candidatus Sulfotelmatobacter sp.]